MNRLDKLLISLASLLLFIASVIFCAGAYAQMPTVLNPDPSYWYNQYLREKARADNLAKVGKLAIDGLQASLKAANDTIKGQNKTIEIIVDDRDTATDRAAKAETQVEKLEADRPKTRFGRIWKDFTMGVKIALPAAFVGYVAGKF